MKQKFLREQWDNSLVLYRMKEKSGDKEGMKQVIMRITAQLRAADLARERETVEVHGDTEFLGEIDSARAGSKDINSLMEALHEEQPPSEDSQNETPRSNGSGIVNTNERAAVHSEPHLPPRNEPVKVKGSLVIDNDTKPKKREKNTERSDNADEQSSNSLTFQQKWMSSTIYNTAFTTNRRRYIFIPAQVFLLVMIIISTAVANVAGGILCGIIGGLLAAGLSGWIIWSYKGKSFGMAYVVLFYVGEAIAVLMGIVGGFSMNPKFFFYVGLIGIVVCILVTVLGCITVIQPWAKEQEHKGELV